MLKKEKLPLINDTILLEGESGTGKSTLAKWIHGQSVRQNRSFYQLNIASLSEQLFESEMFGHVRGSFTGAVCDKVGFCEKVGGGTLFLDEIGDLSMELQKKILTLLEENVFYSVGSTEPKKFRGNLIFATNKNLKKMIKDGTFREDLFYRLCTFTYILKPLRDFQEIGEIIEAEFEQQKVTHNRPYLQMTECAKNYLSSYAFPGNFRELKQLMKYLAFVSSKEVQISSFPDWMRDKELIQRKTDNYYEALENFEKSFLLGKLKKYQGKINFTAEKINISKVTLISKIKKYDINIQQLKFI